MSKRFDWVPNPERGEWLRSMEAEPFGSILSVVPRGFQMYARIFHPVERDRPQKTKTWQGVDESTYFDEADDIDIALETQSTTWANAAASFATTMHPEAQYDRLVRRDYGNSDGAIAPDGWRYSEPLEGCLDATSLSVASVVLGRHTTTPDAGVAAVWDGWGGLVSSAGVMRLGFGSGSESPEFNTDEPEPGSGLLSGEVAAGPRLDLHAQTGRQYVLFEAGANAFADADWTSRAPWVGDMMWAQSPSILWPEDHSWALATEIDFDSTLIAGTTALIRELMQTPGLEVLPIRTDADLSWDGDVINRPA